MSALLDDIDARPGSVVSLLRTLVGLYLRRLGGWVGTADLVRLLGELGVEPAQARTGIARLRGKGLLLPERRAVAGYALNPAAHAMLERGDRRIFSRPRMAAGDPWCLISFTIAERQREARGRLRRRLQWIGAGTVAPGLWICPGYLAPEAEQILHELELRQHATLFQATQPQSGDSLPEAVARWWDLEALARAHHEFLAAARVNPGTDAQEALQRYVHLIDSWRPIPYIDPGLPHALLPEDWPGNESSEVFARLAAAFEGAAWARVQAVCGVPGA